MSGRPVKVSKSKLNADRSSTGGIWASRQVGWLPVQKRSARPEFEQRLSSCVLHPFEGLGGVAGALSLLRPAISSEIYC
jgi:hypothetical protein